MNFVYWLGWSFFRVFYATYLRHRAFNPERVPKTGAVILASNHASILDPPLVGIGLNRECTFLARETLFNLAPIRWLLTRWQAIPIDRDGSGAAGMKRILAALEKGRAVILFPEGTRTRDGQLQSVRSGIGLLAIKSQAPVVPVRVWGTFEAMGRGVHFPKPKRVMAKYGEPMLFTELRAESKNCSKERLKEIYQQVSSEILAAIAQLEPRPD
ncbi:MAG TPA: lysophospholipid acyltransferase family protein [Methylomirabilota bacterium]|nr:lysophospholipid acyltransferase family protein [Methylomirabilota bacterium]